MEAWFKDSFVSKAHAWTVLPSRRKVFLLASFLDSLVNHSKWKALFSKSAGSTILYQAKKTQPVSALRKVFLRKQNIHRGWLHTHHFEPRGEASFAVLPRWRVRRWDMQVSSHFVWNPLANKVPFPVGAHTTGICSQTCKGFRNENIVLYFLQVSSDVQEKETFSPL